MYIYIYVTHHTRPEVSLVQVSWPAVNMGISQENPWEQHISVSKYLIIYSYVCWFIVEPMKTSSILPDNTQQFLEFSQPTDSLGHHNAVPLRLGLGFEPHPNAWAVCTANVPPRRWDCGLVQRVSDTNVQNGIPMSWMTLNIQNNIDIAHTYIYIIYIHYIYTYIYTAKPLRETPESQPMDP